MTNVSRDRAMQAVRYLRSVTGYPAVHYSTDEKSLVVDGITELSVVSGRDRSAVIAQALVGGPVLYVGAIRPPGRNSILGEGFKPSGPGEYVVAHRFSDYSELLKWKVDGLWTQERRAGKE